MVILNGARPPPHPKVGHPPQRPPLGSAHGYSRGCSKLVGGCKVRIKVHLLTPAPSIVEIVAVSPPPSPQYVTVHCTPRQWQQCPLPALLAGERDTEPPTVET